MKLRAACRASIQQNDESWPSTCVCARSWSVGSALWDVVGPVHIHDAYRSAETARADGRIAASREEAGPATDECDVLLNAPHSPALHWLIKHQSSSSILSKFVVVRMGCVRKGLIMDM